MSVILHLYPLKKILILVIGKHFWTGKCAWGLQLFPVARAEYQIIVEKKLGLSAMEGFHAYVDNVLFLAVYCRVQCHCWLSSEVFGKHSQTCECEMGYNRLFIWSNQNNYFAYSTWLL